MTHGGRPLAPGQLLLAKYRVDRVLGHGGMGVVYAATDEQLKRRVAIKVMRGRHGAHPQAARRFLREAQAASRLTSEYSARLLDFGESDEGAFMVLEHLEGEDLEAVAARGPLPVVDAVDAVIQAAAGLAEAHAMGVVHRDVKPANLFLTSRPDGSACVKVLDFGVSRFLSPGESPLTWTGAAIGTPSYMAPEQIRSARSADARSDVWALGAVLYVLLTGDPPFSGDEVGAVFARVLELEPTGVDVLRPEVPAGLAEVVFACLAKDPDARIGSMRELASRLAPFGSAEGAVAARRADIQPLAERPSPAAPPDEEDTLGERDLDETPEKARFHSFAGLDTIEEHSAAPTVEGVSLLSSVTESAPLAPARRGRSRLAVGVLLTIAVVASVAVFVARPPRPEVDSSMGLSAEPAAHPPPSSATSLPGGAAPEPSVAREGEPSAVASVSTAPAVAASTALSTAVARAPRSVPVPSAESAPSASARRRPTLY